MLIFIIAVFVIMIPVALGILLAFAAARLDTAVTETRLALETRDVGYNPAVTFGHRIKVEADLDVQLREARLLAAQRAAAVPRGANMRIGRLGASTLRSAAQALEHDPLTAVRIAAFHGWDGARMGAPTDVVPAAPVATPTGAAPTTSPEDLVPGKDYPYIEITDDMPPEEVRKARVANAKARSAAVKALKQAGPAAAPATDMPAPAAPQGAPAVAPAAAAAAAGIPEPDYIEITDDMPPEEVRKARVANAKMKSAYHKSLKQAGVDLSAATGDGAAVAAATAGPAATSESPQAATPAEPTPVTTYASAVVPANVPRPDYIEITDDMPPEEVRKARVHNARERSRYAKALKEAGIDPQTVEM